MDPQGCKRITKKISNKKSFQGLTAQSPVWREKGFISVSNIGLGKPKPCSLWWAYKQGKWKKGNWKGGRTAGGKRRGGGGVGD